MLVQTLLEFFKHHEKTLFKVRLLFTESFF